MHEREANGLCRLKLYADKLYNISMLIKAAWSIRHGYLFDWMTTENSIMSAIRVSVEWSFKAIIERSRYIDFVKGQKLQENAVSKYYHVAVLLSNLLLYLSLRWKSSVILWSGTSHFGRIF
jgi:hypothetical protein